MINVSLQFWITRVIEAAVMIGLNARIFGVAFPGFRVPGRTCNVPLDLSRCSVRDSVFNRLCPVQRYDIGDVVFCFVQSASVPNVGFVAWIIIELNMEE